MDSKTPDELTHDEFRKWFWERGMPYELGRYSGIDEIWAKAAKKFYEPLWERAAALETELTAARKQADELRAERDEARLKLTREQVDRHQENGRLASDLILAEAERDEARGMLASLSDVVNQEIRENGNWKDQAEFSDDLRPFVRRLVDYCRDKSKAETAQLRADLAAAQHRIRLLMDSDGEVYSARAEVGKLQAQLVDAQAARSRASAPVKWQKIREK